MTSQKLGYTTLAIGAGFAAVSALYGGFVVVAGWPYQFPVEWLQARRSLTT